MITDEQRQVVKATFDFLAPSLTEVAGAFVDSPEAAVAEAAGRFDEMIPDLAYADDPGHPMAIFLFWCSATLALYITLRDRGVDVHDYGRVMYAVTEKTPIPEPSLEAQLPRYIAASEASLTNPKRGEFVFEVLTEGDDFDFGVNIKSCAICHQFSKFDAIELVPYLCATDDIMSTRADEGLRRTGTIALGAHQCDFRYQHGGSPLPLPDQYPDQIRIRSANSPGR